MQGNASNLLWALLIAASSGAVATVINKVFESKKVRADTDLTVQTTYSGILKDVTKQLEDSEAKCDRQLKESQARHDQQILFVTKMFNMRIKELEDDLRRLRNAYPGDDSN